MSLVSRITKRAVAIGEKNYTLYLLVMLPTYWLATLLLSVLLTICIVGMTFESLFKGRRKMIVGDCKEIWKTWKSVFTEEHSPARVWTRSQYQTWQARKMLQSLTS